MPRTGKSGSIKHIATLSDPPAAVVTDTTVTIKFTTNQGSGIVSIIVDENTDEPTPAQIRAGLEAAGGAADFDASRTPQVKNTDFSFTGLTAETQYDAWIVQTNSAGDSNVANVQFTTEAA